VTILFPISDIHVGYANYNIPKSTLLTDENIYRTLQHLEGLNDVIVCACGDIGERLLGVTWCERALRLFPNIRIVYTPGNHEFYGMNMDVFMHDLHCLDVTSDRLFILDGTYKYAHVIDDITFIGATLWTDFNKENAGVENIAYRNMNDYNYIMSGNDRKTVSINRILNEHYEQKKNIFRELERSTTDKCVVISHHQPFLGTMVHGGVHDALSYAYQVDLEKELNSCIKLPQYWFSGHTHTSVSTVRKYTNGEVHFISNQYGYPVETTTGYTNLCTLTI
jgi:hypothetical protein